MRPTRGQTITAHADLPHIKGGRNMNRLFPDPVAIQIHYGHEAKLRWPRLALASMHHSQNGSEVLEQAWCKLSNCHPVNQTVLRQHRTNNPPCCTNYRLCWTSNNPRSSQLQYYTSRLYQMNQSECTALYLQYHAGPGKLLNLLISNDTVVWLISACAYHSRW